MLTFLIGLILLSSWVIAGEEIEPKALFESRCSMCHTLERPLTVKKSAAGWMETVTRMRGKSPGTISEADAEIIAKYLFEIRGK